MIEDANIHNPSKGKDIDARAEGLAATVNRLHEACDTLAKVNYMLMAGIERVFDVDPSKYSVVHIMDDPEWSDEVQDISDPCFYDAVDDLVYVSTRVAKRSLGELRGQLNLRDKVPGTQSMLFQSKEWAQMDDAIAPPQNHTTDD